MHSLRVSSLALGILGSSLLVHSASADWPLDGLPLCTAADTQADPQIVSDGSGGAYVTWSDNRSVDPSTEIYLQRVDGAGMPQWAADGVVICSHAGGSRHPRIVSDGNGGCIVTWVDSRNGHPDIYAQRVDAAGLPQWTANGVALCVAGGAQESPQIASDGSGGAIVTWQDQSVVGPDIYAQRVDGAGVPQWTANGVALCTAAGTQEELQIASDAAGGAIVTWEDQRSGIRDVYAQRVDGSGVPLWTLNGVGICTATGGQLNPTVAIDGAGGAIVAWTDERSGFADIYAQRVNGAGAPQWTSNGVGLCIAAQEQFATQIAPDGSGGAIVTWVDRRNRFVSGEDIYVQRVNGAGAPQWTSNGVAVCVANGSQFTPQIVSDPTGGAVVTWWDWRNGGNDIYAQRVDATGAAQWLTDGLSLCASGVTQPFPQIASDGMGGAIVTWADEREGPPYSDIYAQRVQAVAGGSEWNPLVGSGFAVSQSFDVPGVAAPAPENGCCPCWSLEPPPCPAGSRAIRTSAAGAPPDAWSCYCWRSFDPPYVTRFDYQLSSQSVLDGVRFGGIVVPTGFSGANAVTDAGDTLWNLQEGVDVDFSPGVTQFTISNIPLIIDYVTFSGDEFPLGIRLTPDTLQSSFTVNATPNVTAVGEPDGPAAEFVGPFPNPGSKVILFGVVTARAGALDVRILDVAGRVVRSIHQGPVAAGRHSFEWDFRSDDGGMVAKGVYLISVDGAVHVAGRKVVLR